MVNMKKADKVSTATEKDKTGKVEDQVIGAKDKSFTKIRPENSRPRVDPAIDKYPLN